MTALELMGKIITQFEIAKYVGINKQEFIKGNIKPLKGYRR